MNPIRIEYDDDQLNVVEKLNEELKPHGLAFVDDELPHDGYQLLTLQMTCKLPSSGGTAPAELLAYVQHKSNCEALDVMWHKGPCTCGLSRLLKNVPNWVKPHLGPGAVVCTTCGDQKSPEPCPNCKE